MRNIAAFVAVSSLLCACGPSAGSGPIGPSTSNLATTPVQPHASYSVGIQNYDTSKALVLHTWHVSSCMTQWIPNTTVRVTQFYDATVETSTTGACAKSDAEADIVFSFGGKPGTSITARFLKSPTHSSWEVRRIEGKGTLKVQTGISRKITIVCTDSTNTYTFCKVIL